VAPLGEARPAWKVLRVLGNLFGCQGFDYVSSEEVLSELRQKCADLKADNTMSWRLPEALKSAQLTGSSTLVRVSEIQTYAWDSLQRRAGALQSTPDAYEATIRINTNLAKRLGLAEGDRATATQNGAKVMLPVVIDDAVADDSVLIHSGLVETAVLNGDLSEVELARV